MSLSALVRIERQFELSVTDIRDAVLSLCEKAILSLKFAVGSDSGCL